MGCGCRKSQGWSYLANPRLHDCRNGVAPVTMRQRHVRLITRPCLRLFSKPLRRLLHAFSFSYLSLSQAFLTLYLLSFTPFVSTLCSFHFQTEFIDLTILSLPRQPSASLHKPFFSTSSYTSISFCPPCALLTSYLRASSYCDGHCTISHACPTPILQRSLFMCSSTFTRPNTHICLQPHHSPHIPPVTIASRL